MIGIFGGTFDPVHLGHLRPALELAEVLELERLHIMPAGNPPHRRPPRATTEQRLEMLRRGVAGQSGFILDEREIRRDGPSYMVETLAELRAEVGESTPLALLLGMDAFLGLVNWHQWERIAELAHVVVSHRPGWSPHGLEDQGGALADFTAARRVLETQALHRLPAGHLFLQPVSQLDISSSRIRELLATGHSPRYLLPESVHDYIQDNRLYMEN
ncbi:MAG: nicotinate-nucleotide adenylyltransferase [Pseudomonadota bacterium]